MAIVGLYSGHAEMLKKEFGDAMELTIYSADEDKKLSGLRDYQKVFIVSNFTARRHLEILRSVGQEPQPVGGMGQLKAALKNYVSVFAH